MVAPPFGTASAYTDSFPAPPPRQLTISAETCFNLSLFKETVRQYRKLDDQIITRLNRAQAQLRDQSRTASSSNSKGVEGMCLGLWEEMMAGWAHRQTMLSYCLNIVGQSVESKKPGYTPGHEQLAAPIPGAESSRHRGWKEEEVLANQLANEESIEAIIRKRSLEAFKSRCPFFAPAPGTPSKAWWDLAESGRVGKGPELV
ncbi:caffeine-induced death protein 2-domain-containing protein [Papiliotrema laurentii]|uniref:Caffeine-induced death protein 2-domain-containing protein n=1 Tax=Papiliotrema laurentii TaxID=5418 RepID=A0AAD9FUN6_PAPLA|nr:caffeine-induced death protein 2-domain-containing protein [Papiliotrema laurentii]